MNRRVFVMDRLCYLIVALPGFYTLLNHVTRRCHIKLNTMVLSHYLNTKTVINSFGAKCQTTFIQTINWKEVYTKTLKDWMSNFVAPDETAHCEPSHLDLRCLQKPIIIARGSERVKQGVCLFVLWFYGPGNPMGSCRARSVYLTTRLLGRLSPISS